MPRSQGASGTQILLEATHPASVSNPEHGTRTLPHERQPEACEVTCFTSFKSMFPKYMMSKPFCFLLDVLLLHILENVVWELLV